MQLDVGQDLWMIVSIVCSSSILLHTNENSSCCTCSIDVVDAPRMPSGGRGIYRPAVQPVVSSCLKFKQSICILKFSAAHANKLKCNLLLITVYVRAYVRRRPSGTDQ